MNDNAKRWVEALRSGEYTQTNGSLRQNNEFCCLGVACELAKDELGLSVSHKTWFDGRTRTYYDGADNFLPERVMRWLGLRTQNGEYWMAGLHFQSLAGKNDMGVPFRTIADLIESEPVELFEKERTYSE